jgi:hypothetical protein
LRLSTTANFNGIDYATVSSSVILDPHALDYLNSKDALQKLSADSLNALHVFNS